MSRSHSWVQDLTGSTSGRRRRSRPHTNAILVGCTKIRPLRLSRIILLHVLMRLPAFARLANTRKCRFQRGHTAADIVRFADGTCNYCERHTCLDCALDKRELDADARGKRVRLSHKLLHVISKLRRGLQLNGLGSHIWYRNTPWKSTFRPGGGASAGYIAGAAARCRLGQSTKLRA